MKDNETLAFRVKLPLPGRDSFNQRRHLTVLEIWHRDPRNHRCGWAFPRLTKSQTAMLRSMAEGEAKFGPWFLRDRAKQSRRPEEAETMLRALVVLIADRFDIKITTEEATLTAIRLLHEPYDNVRSSLCFLPGYHSNFAEDRELDREEHMLEVLCCVAMNLLREKRRWWQHPRWHVRHWKISFTLPADIRAAFRHG